MQLPILNPAPIVTQYAFEFQDLFSNKCQYEHFQNYLTGLIVLPNKSMANIARCLVESADKTNISRYMSSTGWDEEAVNTRRVRLMLEKTHILRQGAKVRALALDDTLCEHSGNLFEHIARHYNHSNGSYPLAHNLVTSHYVSEAVRFPLDAREYRRYEEYTHWEAFVAKHFPEREIPRQKKARKQFRKEVTPTLLEDAEFAKLHEQFCTKLDLAVDLVETAVGRGIAFDVALFDAWYLAPQLVERLKYHHIDWISLLKHNRNLESNSFMLRDAQGQPVLLPKPHIKVQDLVALIPKNAYKPLQLKDQTYWCFTFTARIPSLGKVRLVISFNNPDLNGNYAVLISNRRDWSAHQILQTYLLRWPIETFYQDGKQHLGLNEYRMRSATAIQKHWCLVFVAYSLLHLDSLSPLLAERTQAPLKTIGEAARQQGQLLMQTLILRAHDWLSAGQSAAEVFAFLFAKQGAVLTT